MTSTTINEIKAKRKTLIDNQLPVSSMGVKPALRKIKQKESVDSYDAYTRQRVIDFLILAADDYGIPSQIFTEVLTNYEMEEIATVVERRLGEELRRLSI